MKKSELIKNVSILSSSALMSIIELSLDKIPEFTHRTLKDTLIMVGVLSTVPSITIMQDLDKNKLTDLNLILTSIVDIIKRSNTEKVFTRLNTEITVLREYLISLDPENDEEEEEEEVTTKITKIDFDDLPEKVRDEILSIIGANK